MTVPLFFHDTVLPRDPDGFAVWQLEHYLEHKQFVQLGLAANPQFQIPDYDLSVVVSGDPLLLTSWMNTHASVHDAVRQFTNVSSGIDLSDGALDGEDENFWYQWMDNHASEHRAFRQALNLT